MSGYNQIFRKKKQREEGRRERDRIFSLGRYLPRGDMNEVLKMFMEIWTHYFIFY